ncbi:unnamed protein product [Didymodactylos carnosus]|uniref:Uncharacterized protein n=1 Tax=Didymodactylos carnosus TaxID=1234261 RepID=A0A815WUL5_9BILA|nr:unnamed protein product [Didymodactylos carnosus]CAF1558405.1 unnamed protein product [Didymodactylos carnosus]CAF4349744.1 unnamed protein product [Didymodactylos carnosus]CAF4409701.1 unnamed protein product [Didymodactylos carnosus]
MPGPCFYILSRNRDTGEINVLFQESKHDYDGLFDAYDVTEVLTKDVVSPTFILDQSNTEYRYKPFQEIT